MRQPGESVWQQNMMSFIFNVSTQSQQNTDNYFHVVVAASVMLC